MKIPKEYSKDAEAMPLLLRGLLDSELQAGNSIVEVGHNFPAPPAGAYFKLARPVTTHRHESGGGIDFYDRATPYYSGEFTDAKRFFFILEPPHPQPPEPDMDAIRAAHTPEFVPLRRPTNVQPLSSSSALPDSPLHRFERSMVIDYEKWHDGIGYDLEALREATPAERKVIEETLNRKSPLDWRDIEALAELETPRARKVLKAAKSDSNPEVRMAVLRYAPELFTNEERATSIVQALKTAKLFGGLSETLDQVEVFHPKEVIAELFRGVLEREGDIAVHFASMLLFIFGKASEPFDMERRPFFLRFNTEDAAERQKAYRELCEMVDVKPKDHYHSSTKRR